MRTNDAALTALDRIAGYVTEGRDVFDASADHQLALVFLWTNVGSLLWQYCRKLDILTGTAASLSEFAPDTQARGGRPLTAAVRV
jgi:hypothetical protein